ncbi:type II toxin-antitoxin system HicA family toxin [Methanomicrobium antiquum]|uniref:Type II toxin-antitoxin system HicA family toxin n=1 Tax=Methanomicrobium antiquum TaxID=487686 RepID=A0AAF0FJN1_9EURY|nr:type II toxin-antitoxin system HicA family toxin [Methanomicrobium antiquum]WFN35808.1 type II toxin-antitoxin system HicA family toxin [Methanomicrobium antiquum]
MLRPEELKWDVVVTIERSHRQYKNPEIAGRITIPGNMNDTLAPGTLNSVLKQAGIKERR